MPDEIDGEAAVVTGNDGPPAIDLHCHFWPDGFLRAAQAGTDYFGWVAEPAGDGVYRLEGGPQPVTAALPESDLDVAEERLAARRAEQGISMEAVMMSGFLWNYHLPKMASASFARESNDELADLEHRSPGHIGLAHLPLPHTDVAVAEVERCVKKLGLRHFGLGTNFEGRNFDHPEIVPVIDAIAAAGATLSTHPVYFGTIGTPERLTNAWLKGGLASPIEAGLSMATIIGSGVLDRYPDFKVWISHGGGTAMYSMGRLDRRWGAAEAASRPMAHPTTDYLRRFWYGNLLHHDTQLRFLVDMVGADRITVGTDHPFEWDHLGGSANWIRAHADLDAGQRDEILWRNAAEFLGVEPIWNTETDGGRDRETA